MRRTTIAALMLLALGLGLLGAGCLDGTETTATADTVVGALPAASTPSASDLPALKLTGDAAAGKTVFTTNCGACHTLADAGTSGAVGPNLDNAKPPKELVVTNVTNGKGGMPPFGKSLTAQQIADVAAYVTKSTGG
jgi:cytochrome c6